MHVFANAFPKSGTHALVKACELLGVPASVNHTNYKQGLPEGVTHHILIKRDPRNIVLSWMRHQEDPLTPGHYIARLRKFGTHSFIDEMSWFEPWLSDRGTFVASYESLIRDDQVMRAIAAHVGTPYLDGAFERLPGETWSWNDTPSDYRSIWNKDIELAWNIEGGPQLLNRWGY